MPDNGQWVLVIIGGGPLHPTAIAAVNAATTRPVRTIAADSGFDQAVAAGIRPDVLVGDLDSISHEGVQAAIESGAFIEAHSPDKDLTDTELALAKAIDAGVPHLVVLAGVGDRIDHGLAAVHALAAPGLAAFDRVEAWWGSTHVTVLHGPRSTTIDAAVGSTVSLVALAGRCTGVTTTGLRWELVDAELDPTSGRGISNIVAGTSATVRVGVGTLLVARPDLPITSPASSGQE
jgi:thiamine pyrophosphokinase